MRKYQDYIIVLLIGGIIAMLAVFFVQEARAARSANWASWEARGCLTWADFDYPDRINPALLEMLCTSVEIGKRVLNKKWRVVLHSDGRPISQHKVFNAIDFHLSDYAEGRDPHPVFYKDLLALHKVLHMTGAAGVIGWGLYVKTPNPFFHIDLRGRSASWCRIGPEGTPYVGFNKCIKYLRYGDNL